MMKPSSFVFTLLILCFVEVVRSERGSGSKTLESPLELVDGDDEQQERQLRRKAPKTQKTGGVKKKKKFNKNTKAPKLKKKKGCPVCKTASNGCVQTPLAGLPCIYIEDTALDYRK